MTISYVYSETWYRFLLYSLKIYAQVHHLDIPIYSHTTLNSNLPWLCCDYNNQHPYAYRKQFNFGGELTFSLARSFPAPGPVQSYGGLSAEVLNYLLILFRTFVPDYNSHLSTPWLHKYRQFQIIIVTIHMISRFRLISITLVSD